MIDVPKLMYDLASDRPVFHSEADFQHALAWRMHEVDRDARIRLEWPVEWPDPRKRIYVDIYLPNLKVAVELKYRTRKLVHQHDGEWFRLRYHSAQDIGRYDFLKDIQRLEQLSLSKRTDVRAGFAILLTNDPLYWKEPQPDVKEAIDAELKLHEGSKKEGEMAFADHAAAGGIDGREEPIRLKGSHRLRWQEYSEVGDGPYREFRYLAIQVGGPCELGELR